MLVKAVLKVARSKGSLRLAGSASLLASPWLIAGVAVVGLLAVSVASGKFRLPRLSK